MRALIGTLVFVTAWFKCGVAAIRAEEGELAVNIHLHLDRSITSRLHQDVLEDEAAVIWRPYGVQIEWANAPDSEARTHGLCLEAMLEPGISEAGPPWPTVLGRAIVNLTAPNLRPIRVSFDATEGVLARGRTLRTSTGRFVQDRELARALGRVLAHEIGHVLLGAPYHDAAGLMREIYRPDELGGPDRAPFRLTCTDVGRLRARLRVLQPGHSDMFLETERDGPDRVPCIPGGAR